MSVITPDHPEDKPGREVLYEYDPETSPRYYIDSWHPEIEEWVEIAWAATEREARDTARKLAIQSGRKVRVWKRRTPAPKIEPLSAIVVDGTLDLAKVEEKPSWATKIIANTIAASHIAANAVTAASIAENAVNVMVRRPIFVLITRDATGLDGKRLPRMVGPFPDVDAALEWGDTHVKNGTYSTARVDPIPQEKS